MSHGEFCWYDYLANDVDQAKRFYTEVMGYRTHPWGDDGYQMWVLANDKAIGGVMKLPAQAAEMGAPPHWMSFVATDDVDATARLCAELGGKVLNGPWDLPTVGRIAILQDPDGAIFGATMFNSEMTPVDPRFAGAFCWSELWANDVEVAFSFYESLFGWTKADSMDMGPMGTYLMFAANGRTVGGIMKKPEGMTMAAWTYCMTSDGLDAATKRIEQNGGSIMNGPMDVPMGRVCYYLDNQRGVFALYELTS